MKADGHGVIPHDLFQQVWWLDLDDELRLAMLYVFAHTTQRGRFPRHPKALAHQCGCDWGWMSEALDALEQQGRIQSYEAKDQLVGEVVGFHSFSLPRNWRFQSLWPETRRYPAREGDPDDKAPHPNPDPSDPDWGQAAGVAPPESVCVRPPAEHLSDDEIEERRAMLRAQLDKILEEGRGLTGMDAADVTDEVF